MIWFCCDETLDGIQMHSLSASDYDHNLISHELPGVVVASECG